MAKRRSQSGGEKTENERPELQSARARAVQTLLVTFWENSKLHRKYIHFSSLFLSFFVPFSNIFQKSLKRGPGSHPRVLKRHQNGSQGCPNGAQGSQNGAPRSSSNKKNKCVPWVSKWSARCHNGVLRSPKVQKKHQKVTRNVTEARNCAAKNKQTNKHTHTNKHPNNKTTSFALQTQTRTPAAGCSPKAT